MRLLHSDKIWCKISGAYRIADDPNDARIGPLAKRLCAVNPERSAWGSDWPHTPRHDLHTGGRDEELPFQPIDTRGLLDLVPRWLGDDALVHRVLVSNPARLYGFLIFCHSGARAQHANPESRNLINARPGSGPVLRAVPE